LRRYHGGVGKKSSHSASKAGAPARSGAVDSGRGDSAADGLERALGDLWRAVAAGNVLAAEYQTSAIVALPELTGGRPEEVERVAENLVRATAEHSPRSDAAAFFRLLMSLGPRPVKRAASQALAECTEDGTYPPSWVTDIGRPAPGRAWRQDNGFGEHEFVAVTFSYAGAEHALLVGISRVEQPALDMIGMGDDPEGMLKSLQEHAQPHQPVEEITLTEARRRIEGPLTQAAEHPAYALDESTTLFLPLARSRVRRLPSDDAGQSVAYTGADRAAAVTEFLGSPEASEAGDPEVARFWATVLTGYSSRVPDEPPAQVGPHKLGAMLLGHVASTFTLTTAQRDGMERAVTAWTRWAAGRQGLDEAAVDQVMTRLPELLDEFADAYDHPYGAASRSYLGDVATWDAELPWLADQLARREFAAPLPGDRDPSMDDVDATDPRGRAKIALAEFADCAGGDAEKIQLLAAAARIVEEVWQDNPTTTWEKAKRLLAEGHSRHDVIHRLAA
jgi:hypothetical protein